MVGPDFEVAWSAYMRPVRERWEARATDEMLSEGRRTYAARRARSLRAPYSEREAACEQAGAVTTCDCRNPDGSHAEGVRWFACKRHLTCDHCRMVRSRREGSRIREALDARLAEAFETSPNTLLVMMTVGVRHSGSVATDRKHLSASWRRFRDAYAHRFGRFPFVGVYEITPGEDKLGHVHAHVLCLWPRGRPGSGNEGDWGLMRELWLDACGDPGAVVFFKAVDNSGAAAGYVAKYVAKGVTSAEFDPFLAAEVASATYNTRFVFSSQRFWLKFTPKCGSCKQPVRRATFKFLDATVVGRYVGLDSFHFWRRERLDRDDERPHEQHRLPFPLRSTSH